MKRSADSLKFEHLWKSLRKDGQLIPDKSTFRPTVFRSLLPRIALCEIDPVMESFTVRLIGEKARELLGFDLKGVDLNTFAQADHLKTRVKRQKLYHDGPMGRAEIAQFRRPDGLIGNYEVTYFPIWGTLGERLVAFLFVETKQPKVISDHSDRDQNIGFLIEDLIDIGSGIPNIEWSTDPIY